MLRSENYSRKNCRQPKRFNQFHSLAPGENGAIAMPIEINPGLAATICLDHRSHRWEGVHHETAYYKCLHTLCSRDADVRGELEREIARCQLRKLSNQHWPENIERKTCPGLSANRNNNNVCYRSEWENL